MTDVANIVCPESKRNLVSVSLSRRTIARRIEDIDADLESQLHNQLRRLLVILLLLMRVLILTTQLSYLSLSEM